MIDVENMSIDEVKHFIEGLEKKNDALVERITKRNRSRKLLKDRVSGQKKSINQLQKRIKVADECCIERESTILKNLREKETLKKRWDKLAYIVIKWHDSVTCPPDWEVFGDMKRIMQELEKSQD